MSERSKDENFQKDIQKLKSQLIFFTFSIVKERGGPDVMETLLNPPLTMYYIRGKKKKGRDITFKNENKQQSAD